MEGFGLPPVLPQAPPQGPEPEHRPLRVGHQRRPSKWQGLKNIFVGGGDGDKKFFPLPSFVIYPRMHYYHNGVVVEENIYNKYKLKNYMVCGQ